MINRNFIYFFCHILVIVLFIDEIDEIYEELDDKEEVCTNQLFATIVASYHIWQHLRGKTFTITRKTPFTGKALQTSCKCYHFIRIMNECQ